MSFLLHKEDQNSSFLEEEENKEKNRRKERRIPDQRSKGSEKEKKAILDQWKKEAEILQDMAPILLSNSLYGNSQNRRHWR